ncbi:unnamed protein product [Phytophthora lilii]|uniref:Unnamed protein product n=1 Tax=Phytophthora lilii TaxID=2077276 RepID=A0A9W6TAF9_9STRA|nr:unnamed protein product [Phytophthora lilii]
MASLIEVGDLYQHIGTGGEFAQTNGVAVHQNDDDEGLGRSYVCSLSSAINLQYQEGESCADLAHNVQSYLSRIVEELHLISAWSSNIYQRQQQRNVSEIDSSENSKQIDDTSFTAMARLAVVTDIELLRRDVAKKQHDLFQRCTTQMTYVQSEIRAAARKQDTLLEELQQRFAEKQRASDQQAQSILALEKVRAESDAQVRAISKTLRQLQQQTSAHPSRISALETSLATVATAQFSHEQELQALHRRVDNYETTHNLQLEAIRRSAEDSLTALRSAQSQLSAKMQVLRLELQELSDCTQKRTQQMLKAVSAVAAGASGKSLFVPAAAVAPRRPSMSNPRTPRAGGSTAMNYSLQSSGPGLNADTLDGMLGGDVSTAQTMMTTGADAVTKNDCFIYAKAALPHRSSAVDTRITARMTSTNNCRGQASSAGACITLIGTGDTKTQDVMVNLLTVQQSTMSVPIGYEDEPRPATATEPSQAATTMINRSDPINPSRRGTHRQKSLSDVNHSEPCKAQTPRLHTKLKQ